MKHGRKNARCPAGLRRPPSGFSLIELLVVMTILLILTSMYWGSSSGSRQRTLQKKCQSNLQKIYVALDIYANDHAGKFPVLADARTSEEALEALVPRYTSDTAVFTCPGSKDSPLLAGDSLLKNKISYAYYMGRAKTEAAEVLMSDRQVDTRSKAKGETVFSSTGKPPGNNHHKYGGNLLFCDGHLELSPAQASASLVFTQGVVLLNPK